MFYAKSRTCNSFLLLPRYFQTGKEAFSRRQLNAGWKLFLQVILKVFAFFFQTKSKASANPPPAADLEDHQLQQQPPVSSANTVTSESNSKPATGALADILDLDFGPVHNNEVNQRNRQYILEQQLPDQLSEAVAASSKSYSTREPLRPSVEISKYSENNIIIEANKAPAALSSSNSSTASSSGSRRPSAASASASRKEPKNSEPKTIEAGGNVLRDTKIEIAGKPLLNIIKASFASRRGDR